MANPLKKMRKKLNQVFPMKLEDEGDMSDISVTRGTADDSPRVVTIRDPTEKYFKKVQRCREEVLKLNFEDRTLSTRFERNMDHILNLETRARSIRDTNEEIQIEKVNNKTRREMLEKCIDRNLEKIAQIVKTPISSRPNQK